MKKFIKIICIILLNLILLCLIIFISDIIIYKKLSNPDIYYNEHPLSTKIPNLHYNTKNISCIYTDDINDYFNDSDKVYSGRKPRGLEYCLGKKKSVCKPITVFGCSYALGQYLEPNQNFSYKLSKALKRPVYNRAISGSGLPHMYYQVQDPEAESFYEQVPPSDTVFYVFIDDHYLRMTIFSDYDPIEGNIHLRYTLRNNKLVKDNYDNIFLNIIKSSPTIKLISLKYTDKYINNPKNADKLTDLALAFFKETRNILEEKWNKKIKFIVIFYNNNKIKYSDVLRKKLEDNNFIVIDTDELTDEDLNSEKYLFQDNLHPKEAAWDLLTPIIIKKLGLNK